MEDKKFHAFLFDAFKGMHDVCADGASIYVFHADKETVNSERHLPKRVSIAIRRVSG